ncbi:MAG: DUF4911 domain-containing protein [Desulfoferrobacter sp.]
MITDSCTIKHFFVRPRDIYFLRFILEGYDGLAVVTTLQPEAGLVQINVAPGCEEELEQILAAEKSRLGLRAVAI